MDNAHKIIIDYPIIITKRLEKKKKDKITKQTIKKTIKADTVFV